MQRKWSLWTHEYLMKLEKKKREQYMEERQETKNKIIVKK
jgi:hypothetical protein